MARGRPRSGEAHAAILDAAIALTREIGYDALSMEGIAMRAGVSKTTIYRRWPSKEMVLAEALEGIMRTIPVPDSGTVERDVLVLMGNLMAMYRDPATAELLSGLVAAMERSDRVAEAVRSGFVARWRAVARTVLRRGVARGELRARVDMNLALDLLSGPLFYRYLMRGRAIDERFTRSVASTILRGLAPSKDAKPK